MSFKVTIISSIFDNICMSMGLSSVVDALPRGSRPCDDHTRSTTLTCRLNCVMVVGFPTRTVKGNTSPQSICAKPGRRRCISRIDREWWNFWEERLGKLSIPSAKETIAVFCFECYHEQQLQQKQREWWPNIVKWSNWINEC